MAKQRRSLSDLSKKERKEFDESLKFLNEMLDGWALAEAVDKLMKRYGLA